MTQRLRLSTSPPGAPGPEHGGPSGERPRCFAFRYARTRPQFPPSTPLKLPSKIAGRLRTIRTCCLTKRTIDPVSTNVRWTNPGHCGHDWPTNTFVDEHRLNVPDQEFTVVMTLENARNIIEAGIAKAKQIGQPMNIAVVDAGTNLTAFVRMDGAWLGSIDIAINKAFTAKAFDISTLELGRNSQPGDQFFGIHVSNHTRVMIFAGGIPIKVSGQIVGAVGVSGGSGEQDQAVAEAVVAAWS
jgi:uncharacterized protein GlcG (DUF336 family)